MLVTIFVVLLVLWLLGFGIHLTAALVNLLLVLAVIAGIVALVDFLRGRRGRL